MRFVQGSVEVILSTPRPVRRSDGEAPSASGIRRHASNQVGLCTQQASSRGFTALLLPQGPPTRVPTQLRI